MIELSVSDVRAALSSVVRPGDRGTGDPGTLLLGTVFHQIFADLVSMDPERSGLRVIVEAGPERERRLEALLDHAWRKLAAPRFLRHAPVLQATSDQVRTAWAAVEALCRWLVGIVVELSEQAANGGGDEDSKARVRSWEHIGGLLRAEVSLVCDLHEPGWAEPVRLLGIADSVLRVPSRAAHCAIELKLGRSAPPIDLGQAALYRILLTRSGAQPAHSALAVLRFSPQLEEQLFEGPALAEAERRLITLIGQLARVPIVAAETAPQPVANRAPAGTTSQLVAATESPGERAVRSEHEEIGRRLTRACREQGVGIEIRGQPEVGPRFLRYEIRLSPGARVDPLRKRMPEVALRLALPQEPIVTAEAGLLFVDVARPDPETVPFETLRDQLPALDPLVGSAQLAIGVNSAGRLQFADLASAGRSHALVAGTTGSGKSEWLRTALAGLLESNTPDTLRLVTIDPKLNAFGDLERSKFLWKPGAWWVPGSGREASEVFDDLIEEMEYRYRLTRESDSDNLAEHVRKTGRPLPRIVCMCDEYMALVTADRETKRSIEQSVTLLGAKARAAGIHLVLATQQPSRNVVSGAIQANLPVRVALTLQSPIESRMIVGVAGAERLTFKGDLLYKDIGDPQRLQAPLLSASERRRLFV